MLDIAVDPEFMNSVVNHPGVHKWACPGRGGITEDLSPIVYSDDNVVLECKPYGGFILTKNDFDSYIVHTLFLPETPSKIVRKCVKAGFRFMFIELGATEIYTSACSSNIPATRLMNWAGFKEEFSRSSFISEGHTEVFGCKSINDYILETQEFKNLGGSFHELVEDTTNHKDDVVHDHYVGATVAMVQSGNIYKAIRVYNKWALLSGYIPIILDKDNSLLVAGHMVIKLNKNLTDMEDISCQ